MFSGIIHIAYSMKENSMCCASDGKMNLPLQSILKARSHLNTILTCPYVR